MRQPVEYRAIRVGDRQGLLEQVPLPQEHCRRVPDVLPGIHDRGVAHRPCGLELRGHGVGNAPVRHEHAVARRGVLHLLQGG